MFLLGYLPKTEYRCFYILINEQIKNENQLKNKTFIHFYLRLHQSMKVRT